MASYTIVQTVQKDSVSSLTGFVVSLTGTVAGNTLVVVTGKVGATSVPTISDNQGGTWTAIQADKRGGMWVRPNITGGNVEITINFNSVHQMGVVMAREYSGATTSPIDVYASATNESSSTSHPVGPTSIPTDAPCLVIMSSSCSVKNTFTVPAGGFGNVLSMNVSYLSVGVTCAMADKMITSAEAQSGTMVSSSSTTSSTRIVVLKLMKNPRLGAFFSFF